MLLGRVIEVISDSGIDCKIKYIEDVKQRLKDVLQELGSAETLSNIDNILDKYDPYFIEDFDSEIIDGAIKYLQKAVEANKLHGDLFWTGASPYGYCADGDVNDAEKIFEWLSSYLKDTLAFLIRDVEENRPRLLEYTRCTGYTPQKENFVLRCYDKLESAFKIEKALIDMSITVKDNVAGNIFFEELMDRINLYTRNIERIKVI